MNCAGRTEWSSTEWAKFWRRGGTEHLHARYVTHAFAPHTHEGYVIAVVGAGVEGFRYRGAAHRIGPGFVSLLNPDEVHTGHAETDEGWLYRTLYPSAEIVAEAVRDVSGRAKPPFFPRAVVYDPDLAQRVWRYHLLSEHEGELAREAAFLELMACAVARYADGSFRPRAVAREPGVVKSIRGYLEANVAAPVTLGDLAELTGLSAYGVLRAFRRQTGLTPHAYQVQRRVALAKKRLYAGEAIASVAAEVGFFDQSHLGRHFKRIVGVPPSLFVRGAAPG